MVMHTPPPPSISPRQMNVLRIVASMAWSDGHLASEEIDLMLDRFSGLFAADAPQHQTLRQELKDYLTQNIPLEELTPKLGSEAEKELVLKLGYEVIQSSSRTPDEPKINLEEAAAYQKLISLLNLPEATVQRVEAEITSAPSSGEELIETLTRQLDEFMNG